MIIRIILLVTCVLSMHVNCIAQNSICDSLATENSEIENYPFKWKQTILPATLIGLGTVALAPTFIKDGSYNATNQIINLRGNNKRLCFDDYIQYMPIIGSLTLGCAGVKAKHSLLGRTAIVATSYATLAVLVKIPKVLIDEKRPEFNEHNSFPSGHTARAFMGAELVRIEYGDWYGVGAYAIATGVGFMRMYNGRHWLNDVVAGAGVGILSARIGEWSYKFWHNILYKKKETNQSFSLTPIINPLNGGYYGMAFNYTL